MTTHPDDPPKTTLSRLENLRNLTRLEIRQDILAQKNDTRQVFHYQIKYFYQNNSLKSSYMPYMGTIQTIEVNKSDPRNPVKMLIPML